MGLGAWRYDSCKPDLNDCCFMNFLRVHHRSWRPVLALAATLALAACSSLDVPRADSYPASDQKKALAGRIADKIRQWPPGEYPIHVSTVSDASFNQGFRKLLSTRLLDRGVALSTQPSGVQLVVETQVVQHPAATMNLNRAPMPVTRLALGIAVARDLVHAPPAAASVAGSLGAMALLADATSYLTEGGASAGPTRTEVLITTSLENADRYLARTADVYYIEDADAVLYQAKEPTPPTQPVPLKSWRVVAPNNTAVPLTP